MGRISSWLCPTEHHRARAIEAGERVRSARTLAAVACGICTLAAAPFLNWWLLLLVAATAVVLATADRRIGRAGQPELVMAVNGLAILAILTLATAVTGG